MEKGDLELRVRRVMNGAGEVYTDLTVHCPRRGHAVPLADCEVCEHGRGVGYDEAAKRPVVRCLAPAALWSGAPKKILPTPADRTPIAQVMTGDVICVTADLGLDELTSLLIERGFSGAPVVDGLGRPIGVISKTDLLRAQLPPTSATVGDLMMPLAFTLPETAPLSQAAALMVEERVHRLPIVSHEGRVVGLLTAFDVLRWLARESGY